MLRITGFFPKKQGFNSNTPSLRGRVSDRGNPPIVNDGLLRHSIPRNDETRSVPARLSEKKQHGGAIVWILVMVALFAALNFAITKGTRSGGASISKEQAALAATEILAYAEAMKRAVQTLQINGCSDTEVSFENPVVAGYEHTPPARNECKIFHPDGGGINYLGPEEDWLDGVNTGKTVYKSWYANENNAVSRLGKPLGSGGVCVSGIADCNELMIGIPYIKKEICIAINKKLNSGHNNLGDPYIDSGFSFATFGGNQIKFQGEYFDNIINMGLASPSNYSNLMAGCIESDNANPGVGSYHFFQVLIVR